MNEERPKGINAAILQLQSRVKCVQRNAANPFHKSRYATLDEVWREVRAEMANAGLVATNWVRVAAHTENIIADESLTVDERIKLVNALGARELVTRITHVDSGESIECAFPLLMQQATAQGAGSAYTYARRYALCAALQIVVGDEDDDGNAASGIAAPSATAKPPAPVRITRGATKAAAPVDINVF